MSESCTIFKPLNDAGKFGSLTVGKCKVYLYGPITIPKGKEIAGTAAAIKPDLSKKSDRLIPFVTSFLFSFCFDTLRYVQMMSRLKSSKATKRIKMNLTIRLSTMKANRKLIYQDGLPRPTINKVINPIMDNSINPK